MYVALQHEVARANCLSMEKSPTQPAQLQKVLCSVEQGAQHRAWRGVVSAWASPQSSERKLLREICVKTGQIEHEEEPFNKPRNSGREVPILMSLVMLNIYQCCYSRCQLWVHASCSFEALADEGLEQGTSSACCGLAEMSAWQVFQDCLMCLCGGWLILEWGREGGRTA